MKILVTTEELGTATSQWSKFKAVLLDKLLLDYLQTQLKDRTDLKNSEFAQTRFTREVENVRKLLRNQDFTEYGEQVIIPEQKKTLHRAFEGNL